MGTIRFNRTGVRIVRHVFWKCSRIEFLKPQFFSKNPIKKWHIFEKFSKFLKKKNKYTSTRELRCSKISDFRKIGKHKDYHRTPTFFDKVGCVFPMVIKLEFRLRQFWDHDHRGGGPTLEYARDSKYEIRLIII